MGFAPTYSGFADRPLSPWVPRLFHFIHYFVKQFKDYILIYKFYEERSLNLILGVKYSKINEQIMKEALTSDEIQCLESKIIEDIGMPSILLMENAGKNAADEIVSFFPKAKKFLVICGGGKNGGDGFATARHLYLKGKKVKLVAMRRDLKDDAEINFKIVSRMKVSIADSLDNKLLKWADVIVDALLGTGISGEVKGKYKELIELINSSGKKVVAIDVPSGLDPTTGEILGIAIKADLTITMGCNKKGFTNKNAKEYTGEIITVNIGFPLEEVRR